MIKETMSIEEAVRAYPGITETLSEMGIDFCCGGKKNLGEALKEKNLEVSSALDFLNRRKDETTEEGMTLKDAMALERPELIAYIIKNHHRKEEKLLGETDALLAKILMVHYAHHGEELSEIYRLFLSLKAELSAHLAKEEKIVFPLMLEMDDEKVSELEDEHEAAGEILHELERRTGGFVAPSDACRTYELAFAKLKELNDDIHIHIFLENSVLFNKEA